MSSCYVTAGEGVCHDPIPSLLPACGRRHVQRLHDPEGGNPHASRSAVAYCRLYLVAAPVPTSAGTSPRVCGQARFFPTTLAIDDPFVSDELSFLLRHTKEPGRGEESPTLSTEIAAEYPVNPGLIWFGKFLQLGVEATIPINERSGKHVGVLGLVHVFIDDLFPHSLGRPIFP